MASLVCSKTHCCLSRFALLETHLALSTSLTDQVTRQTSLTDQVTRQTIDAHFAIRI
jgi:hypothetical protein